MTDLLATLRLLLVTDDAAIAGRDLVALCQAAVQGGATAVQLRLKQAGGRELLGFARALLAVLPVPLFLNDRLDVALAAGAAGVHLGPHDLSPELARRVVPPGFLIGASVGNEAEARRGEAADYWGIGPLRATTTKNDAGAALGLAGAERLRLLAGARPCVVIGSVQPADVALAHAAGFAGVAVVSGILRNDDVAAAAREYSRDR